MKILIIGERNNLEEAEKKFGDRHTFSLVGSHSDAAPYLQQHEVVFDFIIDEEPEELDIFAGHEKLIVFLNTCKVCLHELAYMTNQIIDFYLFGFNGLPTLLNRSTLEVSCLDQRHLEVLKDTCTNLNTEYTIVDDRVGLVTPRVICMIINEA
jgi:3-hydroxybutyryl-CoA dehydrogenase